jgi:hypothetical protein
LNQDWSATLLLPSHIFCLTLGGFGVSSFGLFPRFAEKGARPLNIGIPECICRARLDSGAQTKIAEAPGFVSERA